MITPNNQMHQAHPKRRADDLARYRPLQSVTLDVRRFRDR
jgi:hypothetical protein